MCGRVSGCPGDAAASHDSSCVNSRPSCGRTPSVEKKFPVTNVPLSSCGSPSSGERRRARPIGVAGDALEVGDAVAPVEQIGRRGDLEVPAFFRILLRDDHQPVGRRERQRAKHYGVDRREDRDVRADAECKRDDRGASERGRAAQRSQREPPVGDEIFDPLQAPNISMLFAHALDAAEVGHRESPRVVA